MITVFSVLGKPQAGVRVVQGDAPPMEGYSRRTYPSYEAMMSQGELVRALDLANRLGEEIESVVG
jgi:hypothetical protein